MATPRKPPHLHKKRGRPPRDLSLATLPENWRESMLAKADEGCSRLEIFGALGIHNYEHFVALVDANPDFAAIVKECDRRSQIWWERMGRQGLVLKGFNSVLWMMNMSNRFGWNTSRESSIGAQGQVEAEAKRKLDTFLAERRKLAGIADAEFTPVSPTLPPPADTAPVP